MFAAAAGNSTLGIPKKVGEEFVGKTARDMSRFDWRTIKDGFRAFLKFLSEEEDEPEHSEDAEPPKGMAASIAFTDPDGKVLFVKRAGTEENWPNTWSWPGGKADDGETPAQCAARECKEEIGRDCDPDKLTEFETKRTPYGWDHTTFLHPVDEAFDPVLNGEHSEFAWAAPEEAPDPIHPGVKATLDAMIAKQAADPDGWGADASFEENKHHRDQGGKFSSGGGGAAASEGHLHLRATPSGSGKAAFAVKAGSHADIEKHLSNLHSYVKGGNHPPHHISIENKKTGEVHSATVSPHGIHQRSFGEKSFDAAPDPEGQLSKTTRKEIGEAGSEKREDMPESAFLGPAKTYPVQEFRDGEWHYTRNLLLAAARRARLQGRDDIARKADAIRAREFGSADDAEFEESKHPRGQPGNAGQFGSGGGSKKEDTDIELSRSETPATDLLNSETDDSVTADSLLAAQSQETRDAIAAAEAKIAEGTPTNALVADGGFKNPDGTYTAEREALHQEIVSKILSPAAIAAATPPEGTAPTYTMIGGRGGSGKSWLTRKDGPVDARSAIVLDNDALKGMFPEYHGWNAALLHEESSHVFGMIDRAAREMGLNVVHDATMKTASNARAFVEAYKNAGYNVEGHYMFLPPDQAAQRAIDRFTGTNGRYVPPAYVLGSRTNEKTFDQVKSGFSKWSVYNNNVPRGESPRLVAKSA